MERHKEATIYPLLPKHIERIFEGRDVFCKYVGKGRPRIGEGSKILFYASGGRFEVLGEAIVQVIEFLTPKEAAAKYEERLFITNEELENYRKQRGRPPGKKLLVLRLTNVIRYDKPHKLSKAVTMAGQTLTDIEYRKLLSE